MSIDKSLKKSGGLARSRNVLNRGERIKVLQDEERWPEGRSPFGLPKVRVLKIAKKAKVKKEEVTEEAAVAAPCVRGGPVHLRRVRGDERARVAGDRRAILLLPVSGER